MFNILKKIKSQNNLKTNGAKTKILNIHEFKENFDPIFSEYLKEKGTFFKKSDNLIITQSIDQAILIALSGGKRIRPYLAYILYKICHGNDESKVIKLGLGLETFHSFALMHDDIIDFGLLRHNVSTVNEALFLNLKSQENRVGDLKHISNSQAMLIGDLLFSWSMDSLRNIDSGDDFLKNLREMIDEVIMGQMIDVDLTTRLQSNIREIEAKNNLKTARYTFARPMTFGVILSGFKDKRVLEIVWDIGVCMGNAFQMQDDLLDILSDEKSMGKSVMLDTKQNQHNHLSYFLKNKADDQFRDEFKRFIDDPSVFSPKDIRNLFQKSGAISWVEDEIRKEILKTKDSLAKLNQFSLDESGLIILNDLISYIEKRTS